LIAKVKAECAMHDSITSHCFQFIIALSDKNHSGTYESHKVSVKCEILMTMIYDDVLLRYHVFHAVQD